jgi:hypothetical protein
LGGDNHEKHKRHEILSWVVFNHGKHGIHGRFVLGGGNHEKHERHEILSWVGVTTKNTKGTKFCLGWFLTTEYTEYTEIFVVGLTSTT